MHVELEIFKSAQEVPIESTPEPMAVAIPRLVGFELYGPFAGV